MPLSEVRRSRQEKSRQVRFGKWALRKNEPNRLLGIGRVLKPKFLILAMALLTAGCMTNEAATDLVGNSFVEIPVTEIAGNHSMFVTTTRAASSDNKVFTNARSHT